MRSLKPARIPGGALLALVLLGCCLCASAFADVNITVNELGNGTLVGPGGSLNMPGAAAADPGPGGLASVLSFPLLNPPDLVAGDVQLVQGGVVTDIIRFVPAGTGNPAYPASLLFYSQPDANTHLVNTPNPPSAFYPNVISIPFGATYTPTIGQPGFVSIALTHYTFNTVACTYSLTPTSANYAAPGGSGAFTVTTPLGCPIVPVASDPFLGFSVNGSTVNYTVAAFGATGVRMGTITVGGQQFTVTQSACTYVLTPNNASYSSDGGSGSFAVTTPAGCPITPTTTNSFVTFTVVGNNVNYTVGANPGPVARPGTITVGGQPFSIAEAGQPQPSDITLFPLKLQFTSGPTSPPSPQTVTINGGDGMGFSVTVNVPWATVTQSSPNLPGFVTVKVAPDKLVPGTIYSGIITVTTGNTTNYIIITYIVQGLPSLVPVPASLTFNYAIGGQLPASQQLNIFASNLTAVPIAVSGSSFVTVSPSSGNTTLALTISVDPSRFAVGSFPGSVTVTASGVTNSPLVVPLTLNVTSSGPQFNSTNVVNAASFQPGPLAPGSLFTVFGSGLTSANVAATTAPAAPGSSLPMSLGGVSMTIGNIPVPLEFVSSGQINAQVPFEVGMGPQPLVVTANGVSKTVPITTAQVGPGTFLVNGRGAILNQDSTLNAPGNGAPGGSTVQVFFTGQGQVSPPVATGAPASLTQLSLAKATVTATIGNVPAQVTFSGLAPGFIGLGQANIQVPSLPANDYTLVLLVNGVPSNTVTMAVR